MISSPHFVIRPVPRSRSGNDDCLSSGRVFLVEGAPTPHRGVCALTRCRCGFSSGKISLNRVAESPQSLCRSAIIPDHLTRSVSSAFSSSEFCFWFFRSLRFLHGFNPDAATPVNRDVHHRRHASPAMRICHASCFVCVRLETGKLRFLPLSSPVGSFLFLPTVKEQTNLQQKEKTS